MGKLLIVNGSPRAPQSNSKKYAEIFQKFWLGEVDIYSVISKQHKEVCMNIEQYDNILFVFPLYVDDIPAVLLGFLKQLNKISFTKTIRAHVLINCGFLEYQQNEVAIEIMHYFFTKNNFTNGMTLNISSGEAILTTPFAFMVERKIKKFAKGIQLGKNDTLTVAMPLTKKMYLKASTKYWIEYGKKFNVSEEQLRTLRIEDV